MEEKKFHGHPMRSPDDRCADPDQDKPPWVRRYLELADLLLKRAQRRLRYTHLKSGEHGDKAA